MSHRYFYMESMVLGPTNQPRRLEVKFGKEGKSMSVSKLKLRHIGPLDCVERF